MEKALLQREKDILERVAVDNESMNKNIETAVASAVLAQATGFHASQQTQLDDQRQMMAKAFEEEYTAQLALVKHGQVQELLKVEEEIDQLKSQLAVYQQVVDDVSTARETCKKLHAQSAAVLCMDDVLHTSKPLSNCIESIKQACVGEELIMNAINTIPSRGAQKGIPTLPELRVRFKVVRKEVRKASLIPEYAPNFLGQMVGSVLASVSWSPGEDTKIDHTTVADKDIEDHLASISYHLDGGDLVQALHEVNHIQGYPRMLINDWETCLTDRIITEQAVSIIKSNIVLKHQQNA